MKAFQKTSAFIKAVRTIHLTELTYALIILAISLVPNKFCSESNNQIPAYHGASL